MEQKRRASRANETLTHSITPMHLILSDEVVRQANTEPKKTISFSSPTSGPPTQPSAPSSPGINPRYTDSLWKLVESDAVLGTLPPPRYSHAAVVWNGKLILFGGNLMHNHKSNDIFCYDYETNICTQWQTSGPLPQERYCHTAELWQDKMIVFGGFDGKNRLNDVCVLDLKTKTWSYPAVGGVAVEPRSHHAACVVATMCWSKLICVGTVPCERLSPCMGVWKTKVVLFGGYTGSLRLNTIHIFHLGKCMWSKPIPSGTIPGPRYDSSLTIIGSKALLVGGNTNSPTNTLHILDLETTEWKELEGSPRVHSSHTASLLPNGKVVLWGSQSHTWNSDLVILDTSRIPDLRFWTFEEAKKEIKLKLKTIESTKSKEDIEHNAFELVRMLSNQFNYLKSETELLSNNNIVLQKKIDRFVEEKSKMKQYSLDQKNTGIIKLNVGGTKFQTTLATLTQVDDSMLAVMFSGRYNLTKDDEGCYFIDRDGTHFRYILNCLRDGKVNIPEDVILYKDLLAEATFYGLESLCATLQSLISNHK